jgi:FAD/FMN-containing dehydrogenase
MRSLTVKKIMKLVLLSLLLSLTACATDWHTGDVQSYNRQTTQQNVKIWTPETVAQIQEVVRESLKSNRKLRVKAASHSTSSLILSEGDYLSTERLVGLISVQNMKVKVKSGTQLGELSDELGKLGYSLGYGYPAFRGLTIGGLLATGAHGSSRIHTAVSSQNLLEMTIIDGLGNVRQLTPADGSGFRAALVHLGLLGVVHDVTLKIYPDFNLQYKFQEISDFLTAEGQAQFGPVADSEIIYWSPVLNKAIKYTGTETKLPANPLARNYMQGDTDQIKLAKDKAFGQALSAGQANPIVNGKIEAFRLDDVR